MRVRTYAFITVGTAIAVALTSCSVSPPSASPTNSPSGQVDGSEIQQRNLEALAKQYGLNPAPNVEVVRLVDKSEWASSQAHCLQEAGFAVEARPDGGVDTTNVPEEQSGRPFQLAMYTCMAQFPIDPKYYVPYTESQLRLVYDYLAGTFSECVANMGYPKPDLPSFGVFVDSYRAQNPFDPFAEISENITEEKWFDVNRSCPPEPSSERLFSQ